MAGFDDSSEITTLQDLLDDGRFLEAERLLAAVGDEPWAGSLRALCLAELGRPDEALEVAEGAVALDPNSPFGHWVVGTLRIERNHLPEARRAADEALRLDSGDSANWALLAQIHAVEESWGPCLEAAKAGLAHDPRDEVCAALRALALRGATSGPEWEAEFERLSHQYPASGWARAGRGWGLLASGQADDARDNFEQALARDPTSEWARFGLMESLKARNPIYSALLQLFLWFDRLEDRVRWTVIIGGILGYRYLREWGQANPDWAPFTYPLLAAWALFIIASWTSEPISNFILSRTETGRTLVRGDELKAAKLVVGLLGTATFLGLVAAITGADRALYGAVASGFLIIPAAAVFQCSPGWPRTTMGLYTAVAALAAVGSVVAPSSLAQGVFFVAMFLAVLGSWLGAFLASRTVRM